MALSTLTDLKVFLNVSGTGSDTYLTAILAAVDAAVKSYCERDIEQGTYTEYPDGYGTPLLYLKQYPVNSITDVWVDPNRAFGTDTKLVADVDYLLRNNKLFRITGTWPQAYAWTKGLLAGELRPSIGVIKVTYSGGYSTVPADVKLAVHMCCAELFNKQGLARPISSESYEDRSISTVGPSPDQIYDIIAPGAFLLAKYRAMRL